MVINTYPSIITLNVNGLNTPIKKYGAADQIKNTRTYNRLPMRDSLQGKGYIQTECEGKQSKMTKWGLQNLQQTKQTLKTKAKGKQQYVMTKGSIQKEGITLINIYALNL